MWYYETNSLGVTAFVTES